MMYPHAEEAIVEAAAENNPPRLLHLDATPILLVRFSH